MADFVRKRLQVFVSSTFTDLIPERQAAVEAILTAGHIPAGMELFTSGDESQMEAIKQWIDESDVYLLILGGRYGSIEPTTGKSYTQLEYEYAVETDKPLFACVVNEAAQEKRVRKHGSKVLETEQPMKLAEFRVTATSKLVKFWDDEKDIKITVGETLANFSRREDLVGWVRPTDHADVAALADELARLSKQNSELRDQLGRRGPTLSIVGVSYNEMKALLISERLFDFFVEAPLAWMDGSHEPTKTQSHDWVQKCDSLQRQGLVQYDLGDYVATPDGRIFLNMYRVEQLRG